MLFLSRDASLIKPAAGIRVNFGHPIANRLRHFWLLNEGGSRTQYDMCGRQNIACADANPQWRRNDPMFPGPVILFNGSGNGLQTPNSFAPGIGNDFTMMCRMYIADPGGSSVYLFGQNNTTNGAQWAISNSAGNTTFQVNAPGNSVASGTGGPLFSQWITGAITSKTGGSPVRSYYVNGVPITAGGDSGFGFSDVTSVKQIGSRGTGNPLANGTMVSWFGLWGRPLSQAEIQEMYVNPWQLFEEPSGFSLFLMPLLNPPNQTIDETLGLGISAGVSFGSSMIIPESLAPAVSVDAAFGAHMVIRESLALDVDVALDAGGQSTVSEELTLAASVDAQLEGNIIAEDFLELDTVEECAIQGGLLVVEAFELDASVELSAEASVIFHEEIDLDADVALDSEASVHFQESLALDVDVALTADSRVIFRDEVELAASLSAGFVLDGSSGGPGQFDPLNSSGIPGQFKPVSSGSDRPGQFRPENSEQDRPGMFKP